MIRALLACIGWRIVALPVDILAGLVWLFTRVGPSEDDEDTGMDEYDA